jgi:hypothetical protein
MHMDDKEMAEAPLTSGEKTTAATKTKTKKTGS